MPSEEHEEAHTATGEPVPDPGHGTEDASAPMTGPQQTHLRALCDEAGEPFDDSLSKVQADTRIDELERRLPGRGQD